MPLSPEVVTRARERVGSFVRRKYHFDALVGIGGTAAVYAATHRNGTRVALKVLHPELALIADIQARFLREGYVANRIAHEGVVRVVDDDDDETFHTVFLVLELLEGETIAERVAHTAASMDESVQWGDRLLDILAAAHDVGVVHRDIKPENLFLTRSGTLKLLDFGIARLLDGSSATRSGLLLGTPAFMSPEQASGHARDVDARSDLWSTGAVLFRLIADRPVHLARSPAEQMLFAATQPAPKLETVVPGISARLGNVVDRALAFERADRWQDARTMRTALREAVGTNR
ncbi:Serine/threonine protein kinase PknB [Labilithrix luteola]|uniref:Serine/threonine protein kinase PknB n=1 Tax=Labilithrix luteola TaxID=1391654 RepID=A0A0K1QF83_9BACT|nr:serine/threonine-protein kinase [Labilithrix luteola]AKV04383.1 Serine/threonine protein kinase PknB [Labilithrix luteola]